MIDGVRVAPVYQDAPGYNSSGKPEAYEHTYPLSLIRDFNQLFYYMANQTLNSSWMGVRLIKYPTDLFIYQELLVERKPELIIETGTFMGGSALYLATVCDALKRGRVVSIDIGRRTDFPIHERITYLTGSSTDPAIVAQITMPEPEKTFVILDSDHRKPHVLDELKTYAPLACYIVVEDTNINGHPVRPDFGEGPFEAVEEFLASPAGAEWERDRNRERFLLTCAPGGFLKRK